MKYVISSFFILFVISGYAQDINVVSEHSEKNNYLTEHLEIGFNSGINIPFAVGENFVSEGTDVSAGIDLGMTVFIYRGLYIHGGLQSAYLDVSDQQLVGNYTESRLTDYFVGLGYGLNLSNRFRIMASVGLGYSSYFNRAENLQDEEVTSVTFRDDGNHFQASLRLNYLLTGALQIYTKATYRKQSLDIVTSERLSTLYDEVDYITFSLGLALNFNLKNSGKDIIIRDR